MPGTATMQNVVLYSHAYFEYRNISGEKHSAAVRAKAPDARKKSKISRHKQDSLVHYQRTDFFAPDTIVPISASRYPCYACRLSGRPRTVVSVTLSRAAAESPLATARPSFPNGMNHRLGWTKARATELARVEAGCRDVPTCIRAERRRQERRLDARYFVAVSIDAHDELRQRAFCNGNLRHNARLIRITELRTEVVVDERELHAFGHRRPWYCGKTHRRVRVFRACRRDVVVLFLPPRLHVSTVNEPQSRGAHGAAGVGLESSAQVELLHGSRTSRKTRVFHRARRGK